MMVALPPKTKQGIKIFKNYTIRDLLVFSCFVVYGVIMFGTSTSMWVKGIIFTLSLLIGYLLIKEFWTDTKNYQMIYYSILFLLRKRNYKSQDFNETSYQVYDNYLKSNGKFIGVIEITGIDFGILSAYKQDKIIKGVRELFQVINKGKIYKLQKQLSFKNYLKQVDKKIEKHKANGLETNVSLLQKEKEIFSTIDSNETEYSSAFYLVIYDSNLNKLNNQLNLAQGIINSAELNCSILGTNDIKHFLELFFKNKPGDDTQFPKINETGKTLKLNDEKYSIISIAKTPPFAKNAWLAKASALKDCKMCIQFTKSKSKTEVLRKIDKSLIELRSQENEKNITDSVKQEIEGKITSLKELIDKVQNGSEEILSCNISFLVREKDKKELMENMRLAELTSNELPLRQMPQYLNMIPLDFINNNKDLNLDIPSMALACSFPFTSKLFIDEEGTYLGYNSESFVMFDLFSSWKHLDNTRKNANMVILGQSGGGKSYFLKKFILQRLLDGNIVFGLDPEDEYRPLLKNVNGNWIDVGGVASGRINPFQIYSNDTEDEEEGKINYYMQHRQFLEAFFKLTLPGLNELEMSVLNLLVDLMYQNKGINKCTDITLLKEDEFPIFDDLYATLESELNNAIKHKDQKLAEMLNALAIQISNFCTDGLYSNIWNGYTTLQITNNFTIFNFKSLFDNSNEKIANAQMLLVMKFLMNEVTKNKNLIAKGKSGNVVIVIDEAHVFINPDYPIALTFMAQMSKRIRKYGGSIITATQNLKDFIGFSTETKVKATAVINNSQYLTCFGLSADDVNTLVELYKSNGGLTDSERQSIVEAKTGEMLMFVSSTKRIQATVEALKYEKETFQ